MDSSDAKLPLCHSRLHNSKSIVQRTWKSGKCISCLIRNYSDLENSVYNCLTHTVSDCEFTLKVLKKSRAHFFQLHCELHKNMTFYVMYDEITPSKAIPVKQTDYGYWAEVPIELVNDPRNKYLSNENSFVVQFHYDYSCSFPGKPIALCGRRTWRDEEEFSRDMMHLLDIRQKTGDLSITVKGEAFPVHRCVFAARTKYFESNEKSVNWNRIYITGEPLLMGKALRYMYCGKLEDTDVEDMLHLLDLASILVMTDLTQTVSNALVKMMTKDNAPKIMRMAKNLKNAYLIEHAKKYLPEPETMLEEQGRGQKGKKKRR